MRPFLFASLFAFVACLSVPAFALSIDRETGMNSDGSAKYTDPDDQQLGLLNTPLVDPSKKQDGLSKDGLSLSQDGNKFNLQVHRLGPQPQVDAFERAYDNK